MNSDQPAFTMKLELVPIPVTDIDAAIDFYVNKVGFHLDHDVSPSPEFRVVQLTPPGSACSIVIGKGMGELDAMPRGVVKGIHLVVKDIHVARAALMERGVTMGEVDDAGRGVMYSHFTDPDGNSWLLQTVPH